DAPFRATSPVADGRIDPGEYGPAIEARFDDDANPGRMYAWSKSRRKSPDDLSVRIHAAHTDRSLFLAFQVRDQVVLTRGAKEADTMNDAVEVFIDGDQVANDQTFIDPLDPAENREGLRLVSEAVAGQWTVPESIANEEWKVGTSRTPDGYIVEFEVPLALIDT